MTTSADYTEKIPNNVSLHEDRRLQRALESWQPNFLSWWESMGPTLPTQEVYLRTAVNVGRDGREEAGELLHRNSGSEDAPRILGAFNEETPDWLSFFMFTYFTDRDGKYQLGTLKESAFDPLSRTCEFMLKEEAHHMFVGTTGIDRVVERTAQLMAEHYPDEVAARGGIPLRGIQKYVNFHYSASLDLFGGETSTDA